MFILGVSAVSTLNSVFLKKFKATIDCKNSFSFYNQFLYKFFFMGDNTALKKQFFSLYQFVNSKALTQGV